MVRLGRPSRRHAIARAYAGHTDTLSGSALTYIRGLPTEVATALTTLTGEPHPLLQETATALAAMTGQAHLLAHL